MNYKYLDRPPKVGDLDVWDHLGSPAYIDLGTPYEVLKVTDTLVRIRGMDGHLVTLGGRGRKVLDTCPGVEAKVGDLVYRHLDTSAGCPIRGTFVVQDGLHSRNKNYYGDQLAIPKSNTIVIKTEETHKHTQPKQETKMTDQYKQPGKRYSVFNSDGSINHKGLIYQELGNTSSDNRPFVQELIRDEVEKTLAKIRKTNFKKQAIKHSPKCDIKLLAIIQQLYDFKHSDDITLTGAIKATEQYYTYKKLSSAKVDHSWIQSYLTKENLHSVDTITLFKSAARQLYIQSGTIDYYEDNVTYSMPIQYNETTKEFYL